MRKQPTAVRRRRSDSMKRKAFLAAFSKSGNLTLAAKAARCCRQQHYAWMEDAAYAAEFETARQIALEVLEAEAQRRAVRGCRRGIFYRGKRVATELEYSDRLLMFLLSAAAPEKYRERQSVEVTGTLDLVGRLAAGRKRLSSSDAES